MFDESNTLEETTKEIPFYYDKTTGKYYYNKEELKFFRKKRRLRMQRKYVNRRKIFNKRSK
jgi:uncharacterized membrane protein YgaE (UPF0421/DUF939 family)